jgi:hypothetical protein
VELLLPETDPALAGLSPDDYTRISELADEVVRMYGGTGPPLDPRHGQAEIEADLFARLTTMPAAWVRPAWLYAAAVTATPDEAVAWMADLFSVPVGWMQRRLLHLGLL